MFKYKGNYYEDYCEYSLKRIITNSFMRRGILAAECYGDILVIAAHGCDDGTLPMREKVVPLIKKYEGMGWVPVLVCCYPFQVAQNNSDLADYVINPGSQSIQYVGWNEKENTITLSERI